MQPERELETVDAGDVLVVGAGAAGVLTAVRVMRRGESVTVIDSVGVGAEQSGHHHGLLHAGTLYVGSSEHLVRALAAGREGWSEWLEGEPPICASTIVPVWDPFKVTQAVAWWADRGLTVERTETPGWLQGSPQVFRTDEPVHDFTPALGRICHGPLDGLTVRVRAARLELAGDSVAAVHGVMPDGRQVRITARKFVLAAGCGLLELLRASGLSRGRLTIRTSFMLLIESIQHPTTALISIEPELGGLFGGSRVDGDMRHLLIGDHLSLAGAVDDSRLRNLWVHATLEKLRALTSLLDAPAVRVGVYAATKAELRDDPNDLSPFAVETYGLSNAVVITPTKLTLAPSLACAADSVLSRMQGQVRRGTPLRGIALDVAPERWRSVATRPLEEAKSWV